MFAVDDETMEHAVLQRLEARGWTLGVAESLTGGLIGARIANVPGASRTFRGSIASYATDVKRSVLGVTAEQVVERGVRGADGRGRAAGARRRRRHRGRPASPGPTSRTASPSAPCGSRSRCRAQPVEAVSTRLPGDRERIRQFSTISLLNILRMRLDALP